MLVRLRPQSIHQASTHGSKQNWAWHKASEDPDLMSFINDHRICLEICLTSNYHTGAVKSLKTIHLNFIMIMDYGLASIQTIDSYLGLISAKNIF